MADVGGTPWLTWVENDGVDDEVRVTRLNGAGSAWEEPVAAASPINQVATNRGDAPSLAVVGGIPWVAWSESVGNGQGDVRASRLEPEVLGTEVAAGATSATFLARLRTDGLSYPVGFAFGRAGAGLTQRTAVRPASGEVVPVVDGLTRRTAYEVQAVATAGTPAPGVRGPVAAFATSEK